MIEPKVPFGKIKRPLRVILLVVYAFYIAGWNCLRLVQGIIFWSILQLYKAKPGPIYIVFSGGIWLVIGLVIAWGLWDRKPWAWSAMLATILVYTSWYWFDRLIVQIPHSNWPIAFITTIILLLSILLTLASPRTRKYFS